jgi:DNA (cytosine-5)-methyltransferase 1
MAGDREDSWGKKKKFREGQAEQTLDDLSFVFIETVAKLRPKVMIMENVEGLILGDAWKYVKKIYKQLSDIGYKCKHWLLKGENMGVPQTRHRVFFVATRLDFDLDKIDMVFNYEPIIYGVFKSKEEKIANGKMSEAIKQIRKGEKINECMQRIYGVNSGITHKLCLEKNVFPTQIAGHGDMWLINGNHPSEKDVLTAQTFPQDYNFGKEQVEYTCGMSVPPIMIKRIVTRLIESGLFDYKVKL